MIGKPLKNLMVVVPTQKDVNVALVPKLIKWAAEGAAILLVTVPFIDNARNVAVRHFLESKKTHLLFVDSDVIPEFDAPRRLLKAKKAIVGGWYNLTLGPNSIGGIEIKPSAYIKFRDGRPLYESMPILPSTGLQKVEVISGGLMLLKKEVLKEMAEPWFEIRWLEPNHLSFEGEDVGFCRKVRNNGLDIWCDTNVFAPHHKNILI